MRGERAARVCGLVALCVQCDRVMMYGGREVAQTSPAAAAAHCTALHCANQLLIGSSTSHDTKHTARETQGGEEEQRERRLLIAATRARGRWGGGGERFSSFDPQWTAHLSRCVVAWQTPISLGPVIDDAAAAMDNLHQQANGEG